MAYDTRPAGLKHFAQSGDNVKNKASRHFPQPGQIFGTRDRKSWLRVSLDVVRLPKEAFSSGSPPSSCFALRIGEAALSKLRWEVTATTSMKAKPG